MIREYAPRETKLSDPRSIGLLNPVKSSMGDSISVVGNNARNINSFLNPKESIRETKLNIQDRQFIEPLRDMERLNPKEQIQEKNLSVAIQKETPRADMVIGLLDNRLSSLMPMAILEAPKTDELGIESVVGKKSVTAPVQEKASAINTIAQMFKPFESKVTGTFGSIKVGMVKSWDAIVLGKKVVKEHTLEDKTTLKGEIALNSDGTVYKVREGTVKTVSAKNTPVEIEGRIWKEGKFVYDGNKFNLAGRGEEVVDHYGSYEISGNGKLNLVWEGDGKGSDSFRAVYGENGQVIKDKTTGLKIEYDGKWKFQPNQTGTLKIRDQTVNIKINHEGFLEKPIDMRINSNGKEIRSQVVGILPNVEGSGYQIISKVSLREGETVKLDGVSGMEPVLKDSYPDMISRTQENATEHISKGLKTEAKISQENGKYVFSEGAISLVTVTAFDAKSQNQKVSYAGAILGKDSHLTVTGETEFPNYQLTVYAGKLNIGERDESDLTYRNGTLFKNSEGTFLTLKDYDEPIPVKDIDTEKRAFKTSMTLDIPPYFFDPQGRGRMFIQELEIGGTIDLQGAEAKLRDGDYKAKVVWSNDGRDLETIIQVKVVDNKIGILKGEKQKWRNHTDASGFSAAAFQNSFYSGFFSEDQHALARTCSLAMAVGLQPLMRIEKISKDFSNFAAKTTPEMIGNSFIKMQESFPPYGNWGGRGWSGGNVTPPLSPVDSLDEVFMRHDMGYDKGDVYKADITLIENLKKLPENPEKWDKPPQNMKYAKTYRSLSTMWFTAKTQKRGE